jgi:hypothetical protein
MQEAPIDPRPKILSNIDFDNCRVEFSDTPIVLLCGGSVPPLKASPDDPDPPLVSLRDAICRAYTKYEVFRPEEITSWQEDAVFKNLMIFEADLASICTIAVIILESAGSLVELGAFSQISDLKNKLIAIRSSDFKDDISFINHGILRYIADDHKTSIKSYPWNIGNPQTITEEIIGDVISDIEKELEQLNRTEVLKINKPSHLMVMICELVNYFRALKETEILHYLASINVNLCREALKRKLFLLERFKLIKKDEYGDSIFYLRSEEKYHRLRLSLKDNKHPDVLRIQTECSNYYRVDPKHKHRIRVITRSERGLN